MIDTKHFSKLVKQARADKGLTQEDVAEFLNGEVSLSTVKRVEEGHSVKTESVIAIAEVLEIPYDAIINDCDIASSLRLYLNSPSKEVHASLADFFIIEHPNIITDLSLKTSLIRLIASLPLMSLLRLADCSSRLGPWYQGFESYFIDQLNFLYNSIPDRDALAYIDLLMEPYEYCRLYGHEPDSEWIKEHKTKLLSPAMQEAEARYIKAQDDFHERMRVYEAWQRDNNSLNRSNMS